MRRAAPLLAAAIAAALLCAVLGGLLRAGVVVPLPADWLGRAAVDHAALMICAFMGTVIGIERAVALKWWPAWLAPASSAVAGIALLAGAREAGAALFVLAGVVFTLASVLVVLRQPVRHTAVLLLGAVCWLAGNIVFALFEAAPTAVPFWFAFLVVTIAAERLEMARMLPQRPRSFALLVALLALLVAGAALGPFLYGGALLGLAVWLVVFDIARRTMHAQGLSRFMALCLLAGYCWLAIAGVAWMLGMRDIALHALGLGFVLSMMLAHAPVILPAVTGWKVRYSGIFYVPLALLQVSLALRILSQREGAVANALALAAFAGVMAAAVSRARARPGRPASRYA